MSKYTINFARSARKELERLSINLVSRIFPRIESLADNPHPRGCRKIRGRSNIWRIRVGDYRVLYAIDEEELTINIRAIRHRREVYR